MAIHKTLKQAREKSGLSLEKAARAIGISGASFSRMENGLSKVTVDRLLVLAKLYQISASSLLEGAIVCNASEIDIDRLKAAVLAVQKVVNDQTAQPSPESVAETVVEIYRSGIDHLSDNVEMLG